MIAEGQTKWAELILESMTLSRDDSLLDELGPDGFPPLVLAIERGYSSIIERLFDLGASVNRLAIELAIDWDTSEVLDPIFAPSRRLSRSSPWITDFQIDESIIHYAITSGCTTSLRLLLSYRIFGLSINSTTTGRTALHIACSLATPKVVQLLLDVHDINVNVQDIDGRTALHLLALHKNYHQATLILRMLVRRGDIDTNLCDKAGDTPLDFFRHFSFGENHEMRSILGDLNDRHLEPPARSMLLRN